ncbi:Fbox domain containing protein [Acanthamoeba castellanii str. Neff]|uniref:Fbox domain containing protein n=1 Tax=Acanthamoeba castellanii (strain ATCC 30010 / Neff) TaxID=1257118 RepID=L8GEK6_ACACF|nr:Fbox domain containing protein [Acanthamoeba castellanii str. Neff]ELR11133.1 Fbox domain containing protein [Acanthamoeba castellanii str. Neff]
MDKESDGREKLPEEMWQEVLRWLPLPDLYAAALACRSWATLSLYDEAFWRQLAERILRSIHKILNVKRAYGMSTQDFYFLMQRAAEEANLMTLDEHFDNWIPTDIVQDFVREFMKGFQNFMTQLGFEPGVELK